MSAPVRELSATSRLVMSFAAVAVPPSARTRTATATMTVAGRNCMGKRLRMRAVPFRIRSCMRDRADTRKAAGPRRLVLLPPVRRPGRVAPVPARSGDSGASGRGHRPLRAPLGPPARHRRLAPLGLETPVQLADPLQDVVGDGLLLVAARLGDALVAERLAIQHGRLRELQARPVSH